MRLELDAQSKRAIEGIKQEINVSATPGRPKGGGGIATAGVGIGLIAGGIGGIAIAAIEILKQLEVFKPILTIAKGIIKVLGEFLRPISDVIVLLLLPILQILKPILLVVRQIMAPFRRLAFSLGRQAAEARAGGDTAAATGLQALSIAAIGQGVVATFAFLTQGIVTSMIDTATFILQSLVGILGTFLAPILSLFGVNADEVVSFLNGKITEGAQIAKDSIGVGIAVVLSTQTALIVAAAAALGADVSTEFGAVNQTLGDLFVGDTNSFKSTFDDFTVGLETQVGNIDNALGGLIDRMKARAEEINAIDVRSGGGGGGGFLNTLGRFGGPITRSIINLVTS